MLMKKYEVEFVKKKMPRACKWLSWWKKRWPVSNDIQPREDKEKRKSYQDRAREGSK